MAAEVIMDSPAALQVPYKSYLTYTTYKNLSNNKKPYLPYKSNVTPFQDPYCIIFSAEVPANPEQYIRRTQQHGG